MDVPDLTYGRWLETPFPIGKKETLVPELELVCLLKLKLFSFSQENVTRLK